MRLLYLKLKLKDLSQGSRIAFIRKFRFMSQYDVSEKLGLSGECKRRTMTRYEKENRNSKDLRTLEIANIFKVDVNSIKQYDYKNLIEIIYTLLWLEELIPNCKLNLDKVQITNNVDINKLKDLTKQRRRWYLGLFQSMKKHHQLFLNYRYGLVSFISYLYFLIYELFSPFIEIIGIMFTILSFFVGLINIKYMILFYLLYALFGTLLSVASFFARIYVNNTKVNFCDFIKVLILCFLEITVLRFYLSMVRMFSFFAYKKRKNNWGTIKRYKMNN